jgi:hypothetical protein
MLKRRITGRYTYRRFAPQPRSVADAPSLFGLCPRLTAGWQWKEEQNIQTQAKGTCPPRPGGRAGHVV